MAVTTIIKTGYYSGIITSFWLALGVAIAGALYPGYSHIHQAMSELGAIGAPTQLLSPAMNNYPLGLLFVAFSGSVWLSFRTSKLAIASALMIAIHGLASISAGYFPCDAGCNPESPSSTQELHNLSGLVMFASLTLAGILWVYLGPKLLGSKLLGGFSLVCITIGLAALAAMAQALESGVGFGFYQRINYGASVIWVSGLAYALLTHRSNEPHSC